MGSQEEELEARRSRLVEGLVRRGYLSSPEAIEAMRSVPRHLFVTERNLADSYADRPLDIGEGQTISAPHMVAIMMEALALRKGLRVLEVGAGSGYHAAVAAHLVAPSGHVFTVERIASLAERARENLVRSGHSRWVTVVTGDGSSGLPEHAPYDRIFVACAAPDVPPPLLHQLGEGGILLVPVGNAYLGQDLLRVRKQGGRQVTETLGGCVFVPLIGEHGFRR